MYLVLAVAILSGCISSVAARSIPHTTAETKHQSIASFQIVDNGNRFLRGHDDADEEERATTNVANQARIWFTNTKFAQAVKTLLVAILLKLKNPPNRLFVKMGVHPDEVYKTLGLKQSMRKAYMYGGWVKVKKSASYKKWRSYQKEWIAKNSDIRM
ncbi:Avirulence (Avh) protein [Phytophthora megakarya]|uniref:RxLR effector protein n=1 Tax=Phytophthora megakarya TaxID=4795 RepID=A0A225V9D2_9STRA|nr:Avirulence (Avh) protein [Phytophthora megakarya]